MLPVYSDVSLKLNLYKIFLICTDLSIGNDNVCYDRIYRKILVLSGKVQQ